MEFKEMLAYISTEPNEMLAYILFERPTKKKNEAQLARLLNLSGKTILAHLGGVEGSLIHEDVLRTMIGIEIWGQRRLKVALGAKLVEDDYDGYRPRQSRAWRHLLDDFAEVRRDTVAIAKDIYAQGNIEQKIPHHYWGDLTARAWLKYLDTHTNFECRKIR